MKNCTYTAGALLTILVACTSGSAQELRLGFQGSLALPTGNLKTYASTRGFGFGTFLEVPFSEGQAVRPRLEYVVFMDQTMQRGSIKETVGSSHAYLGADYLIRPNSAKEGPYLFLGAGLCKTSRDSLVFYSYSFGNQTFSPAISESVSHTRSAFAAGIGYTFAKHWGVELKTTQSDTSGISLNWVQLGVTFCF